MLHPVTVDLFEKYLLFNLSHRILGSAGNGGEEGILRVIYSESLVDELLAPSSLIDCGELLIGVVEALGIGDHSVEGILECIKLIFVIIIAAEAEVKLRTNRADYHIGDVFFNRIVEENGTSLRVDNVSLLIHYVVVGEDALTSFEVVSLYALLRCLDSS